MAKTISKINTGKTKENSEMRRNHSISLSNSMTGKTKKTCPRLANASKSISETMSVLKRDDCLLIVNRVKNGETLKDIFLDIKINSKVSRLQQVDKAYTRGLDYLEADKIT